MTFAERRRKLKPGYKEIQLELFVPKQRVLPGFDSGAAKRQAAGAGRAFGATQNR